MIIINEITIVVFISCFLIYNLGFYFNLKRKKPTKYNVFKLIYEDWVKSRLDRESPLIAVQALRNFIMGNSTFVSGLFVLMGILIGFFQNINLNEEIILGIEGLTLGLIQYSTTILMIMYCLFNFILSIRYATRLSILITGSPRDYSIGEVEGFDVTKETLVHAQTHWMLGIRGLFYLATSFLWYVNSLLFMIFILIITFYLFFTHEIL